MARQKTGAVERTRSDDAEAVTADREGEIVLAGRPLQRFLGGVSKATAFRVARQADFPAPITLHLSVRGFRRGELIAWLESRKTVKPTATKSRRRA
jgi:predicted DNA-binding transcriptional regulator AlpA